MKKLPSGTTHEVLCHCQRKMFEVIRYGDAGIFLSVVCGGIALYDRIIKLEQSEIIAFEQHGESALYDLVYQINKGGHKDREWTKS